MPDSPRTLTTRCCIAGGGPAGMMLGLLLARAGVDVLVLEKHADFLRDFRGDTVHPSTLEVIYELGLLPAFLARPHDEVRELRVVVGDTEVRMVDCSRLRTQCRFIALMPQWDFLDFLCEQAQRHPGFRLIRHADVTGVLQQDGVVRGVQVDTPDGPLCVQADLTIGADGRHSTVRTAAGLTVRDIGAPIDVLWLRLPRLPGDPSVTGARVNTGVFLVMLDRGSYWQCAYVIAKGGIEAVRARGLEAFRAALVRAAPLLADRSLSSEALTPLLARVEKRRLFPARVTQAVQVAIQNRVLGAVVDPANTAPMVLPWQMRLFNRFPILRVLPAWAVGVDVRPEHVPIIKP